MEGVASTVSIIADEDSVDIYAVEKAYIESLFEKNPGLAGKFYKFLCLIMARRVRQREVEELFRLSSSNSHPGSDNKDNKLLLTNLV